jgi:hypothetical protein
VPIFCCGYVKCSILYRGNGSQQTICGCYSWEMTLNVDLDLSFENI